MAGGKEKMGAFGAGRGYSSPFGDLSRPASDYERLPEEPEQDLWSRIIETYPAAGAVDEAYYTPGEGVMVGVPAEATGGPQSLRDREFLERVSLEEAVDRGILELLPEQITDIEALYEGEWRRNEEAGGQVGSEAVGSAGGFAGRMGGLLDRLKDWDRERVAGRWRR